MTLRGRSITAIALLLASTLVVFGRLAAADFVRWDDPDMVFQNPLLNPPTTAGVTAFWRKPFLGLYTPLAYTVWSIPAVLAQPEVNPPAAPQPATLDPAPFHLLNLALHAAAGVFAFLCLKQLVRSPWAAWAGAMLFALHPLQVEPVGWVAGMNNLLCGTLGLAAVWQYVKYAQCRGPAGVGTKTGYGHLAAATVLFLLALLSKPTAVVLPGVVAAVDLWALRRPLKSVAGPVLAWVALAAPFAVIARRAQPAADVFAPPWPGRLLVAADAVGLYARKLIAPFHLTMDYARTPQWVLGHPTAAWATIACMAVGVVVLVLRVRRRSDYRPLAPLAVALVALLPVLGLTPFDFQNYSTVADRYAYLPMFGVALLTAGWLDRLPNRFAWGIAMAALTALAAISFHQAGVWHDTESLALHALAIDPDNPTAHKILAAELAAEGRDGEAEPHFRAAITALATKPHPDGAVWFDYANLLRREGRLPEAARFYREAIPRLGPAARAMAHNNLGVTLADEGDPATAREQFRAALALRPDFVDAKQSLQRLGGE